MGPAVRLSGSSGAAASKFLRGRPGEDARHDGESIQLFDTVTPASDRRIVLAGDAPFLRQDHIREAGNIRHRRVRDATEPLLPHLFGEPEVLVENAEKAMGSGAGRVDVEGREQ